MSDVLIIVCGVVCATVSVQLGAIASVLRGIENKLEIRHGSDAYFLVKETLAKLRDDRIKGK